MGWIFRTAVSHSWNQWKPWAEKPGALNYDSLHGCRSSSWLAQEFRSIYIKSSQVTTKGRWWNDQPFVAWAWCCLVSLFFVCCCWLVVLLFHFVLFFLSPGLRTCAQKTTSSHHRLAIVLWCKIGFQLLLWSFMESHSGKIGAIYLMFLVLHLWN